MIKKGTMWTFLVLTMLLLFTPMLWAGQVVTDDVRAWARQALEQEREIRSIAHKNSVSVLYFGNATGDPAVDPVRKGLALMLITDLAKVKALQVVERIKVQALMEEMALGDAGLTALDTEPRIGLLLGVSFVVGGELISGSDFELGTDARTLAVATAQIIDRWLKEGSLEQLLELEKELVFNIVKTLHIELSREEVEALRAPLSANIFALLHVFRGIDSSDHGNYNRAAKSYQQALDLDPGLKLAADALAELEALGLAHKNENLKALLHSIKSRTSLTDNRFPDDGVRHDRTADNAAGGTTTVIVNWE